MAVTRAEIVATGLALLDEVGLAGLSLRRLAERLQIRAPTLYWHVRDKRELLDLLAEAILAEALADWHQPQPGQAWWEWLAERSRALRSGLLAHRDRALVLSGRRPTPQSLPAIERQLSTLVGFGFTPRDALLGVLSLSAFVIGDVLDVQGQLERARPEASTDRASRRRPSESDARGLRGYPVFDEAIDRVLRDDDPFAQRFEHGLGLLIAGMRASGPRPTPRPVEPASAGRS